MAGFLPLLRANRNYRWLWTGQVVSEIGDHFNNIAVFGLALQITHSGLVVTGIMLSRAIPAIIAGPLAGVVLDRLDRKKIMIASDLVRMVMALGFILAFWYNQSWQLYVFSALLMFASPFFTSGRASILPSIATEDELHTANSVTQTTQWVTLSLGAFLGGLSAWVGYEWAFVFNALSFVVSAFCVSRLHPPEEGFRAQRKEKHAKSAHPWHDYVEGLRYIRSTPLIFGVVLISVGWASGGGAAQILFSLFGELVFNRGTAGIGLLWGCAGVGLVCGGISAHWLGKRISFEQYKKIVFIAYLMHGGAYVVFSQMRSFWWALVFIALSRASVAVSSVLNVGQLLHHVSNQYRGRVFATNETLTWATMMLSMMGAGIASQAYSPRAIGAVSGILSASTAIFWGWANWTGRLPEPEVTSDNEDVEVHGAPVS
jgi:MFS family permease